MFAQYQIHFLLLIFAFFFFLPMQIKILSSSSDWLTLSASLLLAGIKQSVISILYVT